MTRALTGPVAGHRNKCIALLMLAVWGVGWITNPTEDRGTMGHCLGHNDRCTAMESYGGRQGAWEKKVRE